MASIQVHHEVEMSEKISAKNEVFDVSNEKNPPKCTTEPQVEGVGDSEGGLPMRRSLFQDLASVSGGYHSRPRLPMHFSESISGVVMLHC